MRRSLAVAATAALAASALAFAPSMGAQADTTHSVTFSGAGAETIDGDLPGGANLTPFLGAAGIDPACTDSPEGYCETILVEVQQPVADLSDDFEFGLGELTIDVNAVVQGSDFDLYAYESDASGALGKEIAFSANMSACATLCGTAPDPVGLYNDCSSDECLELAISTNEYTGTSWILLEIYYFASPAGYTAELSYTRTDGRNADGTIGAASFDEDDMSAADSAERVDVTSGYEPADDWNGGGDGQEAAALLGQELTGAFIEYGDDTFTFTIEVAELLAIGGTPEATRYGWSFAYDGNAFELDGKFTNYSRGACDPTAGNCPPVRDPGVGFFALRGNCTTADGTNVTLCEELGGVNATFDPADGTITIPIAADLLAPDGVEACDAITGDPSFIGQSVWSASSAFVTSGSFPFDDAMHYLELQVPYANPELSCDA